jgi:hypothetical protein
VTPGEPRRGTLIAAAALRGVAVVAYLALALGGCGKAETQKGVSEPNQSTGAGTVDRLRSLPYVEGTPAAQGEPEGVVLRDAQRSCPGYNFYEMQMLSSAELLDEDGHVVKSWNYSPSDRWEHAELLPNGDVVVIGVDPHVWTDGGPPGRIADEARYLMRLTWDGKVLWKKQIQAHHDIELTPRGELLALTFQRRLVPSIHPKMDSRDDQLTLLAPDGTVLASRSMLEAIAHRPDVLRLKAVQPDVLGGRPWIDLLHSNSLEWLYDEHLVGKHPLYDLDNVLVCFRHQDRVAVFNWTRNEVVWAWGEAELSGPHDAHMLDNGHILVFDNGLGRGASRAVEVDPLTSRIVWEYKATPPDTFYTESKGSVQRLPNGNTLLAESDRGRALEITSTGEAVWKFVCPHKVADGQRAAIVRMKRFPHEFIEAIMAQSPAASPAP